MNQTKKEKICNIENLRCKEWRRESNTDEKCSVKSDFQAYHAKYPIKILESRKFKPFNVGEVYKDQDRPIEQQCLDAHVPNHSDPVEDWSCVVLPGSKSLIERLVHSIQDCSDHYILEIYRCEYESMHMYASL